MSLRTFLRLATHIQMMPVLESGVAWGCALTIITTFLSVIIIFLVAGVLVQILNSRMPGEWVKYCMRVFCVGTIIGLAPVIGLRAASAVAKERQQQTLLSLFVIPEARSRILLAKWIAPLYGVRYWLVALAAAIIVTLFSGGIHPLGVIAGLAYLLGFVPFANSFGLWLSVICKTGTRAATVFLSTMLALMIGPPIFGTLFRALLQVVSDTTYGVLAENFLDNVNPVVGIWRAFADWKDVEGFDGLVNGQPGKVTAIPALLADTVIGFFYMLAAIGFGWRAKTIFDRETA